MLPSILQSIKWDEKYTKSSISFNCILRQCRQRLEHLTIVYTHTHTQIPASSDVHTLVLHEWHMVSPIQCPEDLLACLIT